MSGIKDQERLEELRQRLYERGNRTEATPAHGLSDEPRPVPVSWQNPPKPKEPIPQKEPEVVMPEDTISESDTLPVMKRKRGYRFKLVLIGLIFFVLSVGLSSIFLIGGGNTISGENITIAVTGPFSIGGGEAIPIQVGITNDNSVPIQSATLIVDYPDGTRSPTEDGKELFSERLSLDTINPGETLNVPLRALVFGEENDEKEIKISIEYRVSGSNALFFKEAEPLRFKISSTPIRLSTNNTIKLSSGQETDIKITVTSNSPTPLSDIVIKADYPGAFDFTRSDPDPVLAENVWVIDKLEPEESQTITITGVLVGRETDEYAINLTVGVPAERDPQTLVSVFATERIDFVIEQPFIDIGLKVNGESASEVAVDVDNPFSAIMVLENTLEDSIYDAKIVVTLTGNAISKVDIEPRNGYYNSSDNTVTWDVGSFPALERIDPGRSERVALTIVPSTAVDRTPQVGIKVDVSARRVSENSVAEQLTGTAETMVKIISEPTLSADAGHNNSVFSDTGPIPPQAEKETTYTLSMMIENGTNEITDTEVTASLPPYVTWLDQFSGTGNMTFNPVNRVITWKPGPIEANVSAFVSFQVKMLPSQNMIGTSPTLLGEQRLKATDRFTGTVVRSTHKALLTELSSESGFKSGNGRVTE